MNQGNYDLLCLERLLNELKEDKKQELWIIGNKLDAAKEQWKRIQYRLDTKHVIARFISNNSFSLDGLNPMNARIILLDRWWQNKNAIRLLKDYIPYAKQCRQIGHI
ncbi:hypothetical protein [Bacillus toyonensis]|uniref:hypothetical protein n=1 Tax=Bacillus toyonensis TaxID=155322 RepID=UPI000BFB174A|nr:hypothetical protein [Bacillus toyonensis]PHG57566.1 hypothetical protein COI59_29785 [Bacillus toyonensis]